MTSARARKSYRKLHLIYISLIESESPEDHARANYLRHLIVDHHPEYKISLRVDLVKLLQEKGSTKPHLKTLIPVEHSQLR